MLKYSLLYSLQSRLRESESFTDAPAHYWAQYTLTKKCDIISISILIIVYRIVYYNIL